MWIRCLEYKLNFIDRILYSVGCLFAWFFSQTLLRFPLIYLYDSHSGALTFLRRINYHWNVSIEMYASYYARGSIQWIHLYWTPDLNSQFTFNTLSVELKMSNLKFIQNEMWVKGDGFFPGNKHEFRMNIDSIKQNIFLFLFWNTNHHWLKRRSER